MKTFLKNLPLRIDLWIRANITQRAHWLRVFDKPTYYCDIDRILEAAVYQLAKRYLYDELGSKDKMKPKEIELWGRDNFYKGFRQNVADERTRIDLCLEYIDAYENRDNIELKDYYYTDDYNFAVYKAEDRLSTALITFVKNRKSLWT